MSYEQLHCRSRGPILTISLNRPERMNACTPTMVAELVDAIDVAGRDDNVRAIIVTGEGHAFCAGADLSHGPRTFNLGDLSHSDPRARDLAGLITLKLFDCPKPLIAAVNGAAVGVGATMSLAMDYRLASERARFGFVFTRRGLVPEGCSSWFLPRLVGMGRALDWMLSGRTFGATEALESGLVRSVHSVAELLPAAEAIASEIAANTSAVSVALTRQMLWKLMNAGHPMAAHKIESRCIHALGHSSEAEEGVSSFLEKRAPRFALRVSEDMPAFYPWWIDPPYQ